MNIASSRASFSCVPHNGHSISTTTARVGRTAVVRYFAFLSHCGLMAIRDVLHGMLFSEVALKV